MKDNSNVATRLDPLAWLDDDLAQLDANSLRRERRVGRRVDAAHIEFDGRKYVNFASNDYLGLADHPRVVAAAEAAAREHGWGAGASPLVTGRHAAHARLEARLAEFMGTEAALVLPTGFAANLGTIAALVGRGDIVFSDALNHASLIDGCRLSRATVSVYDHNNLEELERQLAATPSSMARRRLIVTDSLFSMDGQTPRLAELCDLAERYDAMLLVDEAHALGVVGPNGRGVCEAMGVEGRISARVATLSKALGSSGGFVAGSAKLIEWLANRARSYVFSTAATPASAAAAMAALDVVIAEPQRRLQLHDNLLRLTDALSILGWRLSAVDRSRVGDLQPTLGAIVPVIVGDSRQALDLAAQLAERGLWVPAIRPPTVPVGTARLRISLSCAHTPDLLARLVTALGELAN
ncbi:MAG: 8-amino-7-oxononanoate synthase [Pirellulales bacterium]|nr:8-amino-7-oxononanoate synthase [Pirellulales bacterium]